MCKLQFVKHSGVCWLQKVTIELRFTALYYFSKWIYGLFLLFLQATKEKYFISDFVHAV